MVAEVQGSRLSDSNSCPSEMIGEHPAAAVTLLFGVGVGVGLLLGHTIAETSGHRLFHQDTFTEKLTCQIRDLLKNNLPQGLMRHMS
jgi:hypothetical protein